MQGFNRLILGDNLEVLKGLESESVDLIYLDPPFFSNRNYEVVWGDAGEVRSFEDRFSGGVLKFCEWLYARVAEMRRVLKPTGSIYLHCDWHADAYIRVNVLDKIFGEENFRNEIVWCYKRPSAPKQKQLSRLHDTIFWYSKGKKWIFNGDFIRIPYAQSSLARVAYAANASKMTAGGSVELNEGGKLPEDWWDIPMLKGNSHEAIGYPTQKPEALLERIVKASSNEGDLVLDPFCGGGTTLAVADRLGRRWIGIDQSVAAIKVSEARLTKNNAALKKQSPVTAHEGQTGGNLFADPCKFTVELHKYDFETLRYSDAFAFESFIVQAAGGVSNAKQRGDKGIDGHLRDGSPVQVKRQNRVGRPVLDAFRTAAERDNEALFRQNVAERRLCGTIIAFDFTADAIEEASRLKLERGMFFDLKKVEDIVPIAKKPKIALSVVGGEKDEKGSWKIDFCAKAEAEIFQWDFAFDEARGFAAEVLNDKKGLQSRKFEGGAHCVAVKAIDENGIDATETLKFHLNGKIEVE